MALDESSDREFENAGIRLLNERNGANRGPTGTANLHYDSFDGPVFIRP